MDQDVAERFAANESRLASVEASQAKTDSAVTALTAKVDALSASQQVQLEILQRLDHVAANPLVKTVFAILAAAIASWAASKGLK